MPRLPSTSPLMLVRDNMTSREHLFDIVFEGELLPHPLCYVDVCALYDYIPDFPEDTADWLWTFTTCLERRRTDHSQIINKHATAALEAITRNQRCLEDNLIKTGRSKEQIDADIDAWQSGLATIVRHAKAKDACSWIGKK